MVSLPESHVDLFERETFAHFCTHLPDGSVHATPVWIDRDGDDVLVNTARGRRKERNVRTDPRVAVSMTDPDDPYRFLSLRGRVARVTTEGADAHIDELARRYMDVEEYPYHGEERGERVLLYVRPEHVATE